jgi:outer membrane protein assembly factor BamA
MNANSIHKTGFGFLLVFLLVYLCSECAAQATPKPISQMSAAARQLIEIKVTGSKRFPEDAIAASTGLQLGTPVGEDDFKKAARRLGDTGAFTDIGYSFTYSSAGTKLEFKVTDAEKFVPARFEDFVWFSDEELRRRIKEHVPLFDGQLPTSGRMPDEVSDVLQAMLVEKGVPGHVDYVREGKPDGPVEWISYKVSEVLIRIRKIQFIGAGEAEIPPLEAAASRMPDREYSRSRLNQLVQRELLPVYHARGYLKATFGEPQPVAVQQPSTDVIEDGPRNQSVVDVTFAVTPGPQYKLKSVAWSGNKEFPTDTLEKLVHTPIGQPANTVRIGEDLKDVQKLYGTRGFITATVKANAEFDDAAGTVAIHLGVTEGFEYHMGELEFRGLDNSLIAKLRSAWKIRQGDVYDASYLEQYLPVAQKLLPPSLDWDVSSHVTANVHDKTVDVDLIYSVKAPK